MGHEQAQFLCFLTPSLKKIKRMTYSNIILYELLRNGEILCLVLI